MAALDLQAELRRYGAPSEGVIRLDVGPNAAAQVPYLDLCRRSRRARLADAVVELDDQPVLYAVRGIPEQAELLRIRRLLSLRSQADHLALIEPGQMHVIPLVAHAGAKVQSEVISAESEGASMTIPRLGLMADSQRDALSRQVHVDLLDLLTLTIDGVVESTGLDPDAALSWVSRALFFRFLVDREIVKADHLGAICGAGKLEECFVDSKMARATSRWLTEVFNGDLLPLGDGATRLSGRQWETLCAALTNISHRAEASGQMRLDWCTLDFGHLPVGLLSQVYESYSHRFERAKAEQESVHYTPRSLAEYVVAEALHELPHADRARVLDPASGAGVFLVACFRALVRARWQATGKRPGRREIREILYTQLTGFDVNPIALRLSALSLYLTALELDPRPRPISELRFEDLRGRVLHDVSRDDGLGPVDLPPLGSLGAHIPAGHRGRFDLVIGNPPWTSWKPRRNATKAETQARWKRRKEVEDVVAEILARRSPDGDEPARYSMVDWAPDLPFCWRALEWLRPGGRLALLVHARLLFKQSEQGLAARALLFGSMRLTGVLNAAALRQTKVWPDIDAPFCVLFGRNEQPVPEDTFTFVSPYLEDALNRRGIMRVDPSDAMRVSHRELRDEPTLLKTLFRGTELDLAVVEKLRGRGYPTFEDYWESELGLKLGQGWQRGGDARPRKDASHMLGLPELTKWSAPKDSYRLDIDDLPTFAYERLLDRRDPKLYRGPLVLLPQSPPRPGSGRPAVYFSAEDVAFNSSFNGFSCHGHPRAKSLAYYLFLVLASDLVVYSALMASSRFGVERDVYLFEDVRRMPVRPFEDLDEAERRKSSLLARKALRGGLGKDAINEFVFRCHGLGRADIGVVRDTLAVAAPFADSKKHAQRLPTAKEIEDFAACLERKLEPFLRRRGVEVAVRLAGDLFETRSPWLFLTVGPKTDHATLGLREVMARVSDYADEHGASLLTLRQPDTQSVIVGLLRRYRHWTPSRARLVATELRRLHEDFLVGGSK